MMLLELIDKHMALGRQSRSGSSLDKDAVCRQALRAFLQAAAEAPAGMVLGAWTDVAEGSSEADVDVGRAVTSAFIHDFGLFLARGYHKRYAPATCREIIRTLRKHLRRAIAEGLAPNIDVAPLVIERLNSEVWPGQESRPAAASRAASQPNRGEAAAAVSAVMRHIDTWATRRRMGITPEGMSVREARSEALAVRCAAVYLFCLLAGGIEIADALAIRRDPREPDVPRTVRVERLGRSIPLSRPARRLVDIYNQGATSPGHLFATLDNAKYRGDLPRAARLISAHIARYMAARGHRLFRRRSVYADWLNLCIDGGLPPLQAEGLWLRHLGVEAPAPETPPLPHGLLPDSLDEAWHILSVKPGAIRRDRLVSALAASGILGPERRARRRIYAPAASGGRRPSALGRYIFFRATAVQAGYADGLSPYAHVVRDTPRGSYARIQQTDIERLQVMLRDFPTDVELIDKAAWLRRHQSELVRQTRVVLRTPPFQGYEAIIVDIRPGGRWDQSDLSDPSDQSDRSDQSDPSDQSDLSDQSDTSERYYIIRIASDRFTIKATRRAIDLTKA